MGLLHRIQRSVQHSNSARLYIINAPIDPILLSFLKQDVNGVRNLQLYSKGEKTNTTTACIRRRLGMLLNVDDTGNCLLLRADLYMSFDARKFVFGPEESVGYKSTR
jgi:hypothetical protein